jgi:hypothetical protein
MRTVPCACVPLVSMASSFEFIIALRYGPVISFAGRHYAEQVLAIFRIAFGTTTMPLASM